MTYLRNTWYAAAWSDEIVIAPFALILLEEEVLFYRRTNGALVATSNRCPHRFVELHRGAIVDDHIQCPYHGLRFDASGACVLNPHGDNRLPSKRLKTYPVADRHGIVWIWMGDAARVDAGLIPNFSSAAVEQDGYRLIKGRLRVNADYQLVTDNLLDLTHSEFLHPHIRASGSAARASYELLHAADGIHCRWEQDGEPLTGANDLMWQARGGIAGETATVVRDIRWSAASNLLLNITVGRKNEPRHQGAVQESAHLLTPTSRGSTQYLWTNSRNCKVSDVAFDAFLTEQIRHAFQDQDFPVLESQQSYVRNEDLLSLKPIVLASDAGAVRVRMLLRGLISEETKAIAVPEREPQFASTASAVQ